MPRRELLTPTERVHLFAFPGDHSELIRLAAQAWTDSRISGSTSAITNSWGGHRFGETFVCWTGVNAGARYRNSTLRGSTKRAPATNQINELRAPQVAQVWTVP
jgi:hypothetical protein